MHRIISPGQAGGGYKKSTPITTGEVVISTRTRHWSEEIKILNIS